MPRTKIPTIDLIDGRELNVIKDREVVWSSGTHRWRGIAVERHRLKRFDTPEFQIPEHIVVFQLSPETKIESKIRGKYLTVTSPQNSICVFQAGTPMKVRAAGLLETIVVTISPQTLSMASDDPGRTIELINSRSFFDPKIEHIVNSFKADAESGFAAGAIYGESLGLALSACLIASHSNRPTSVSSVRGGMSPQKLNRVIEFINENLATDLRLSELGEVAGLSQYRFSHNFKQSTGLAPHQYIIRARIDRARQLLRYTQTSITTISHELGFGSSGRFSIQFRRATGLTPSSYRARFS